MAKASPLIFAVLSMGAGMLLFSTTFANGQNTNELFRNAPKTKLQETPSGWSLIRCPDECVCSTVSIHDEKPIHLPTVNCTARNITSIPQGIPASVRKLDLSSNNFSRISSEQFKGIEKLRELSLSSNRIDEVASGAFRRLQNLRELTLSRNELKAFPIGAFPGNLEILNMEYNQITYLESAILPNGTQIHALILGRNFIESIDDMAFDGLSSLQLLELDGNRLIEVPMALKKLPNLRELSLANNRITRVDIPFHQIIPRVTFLELRGNPLQVVHPETFSHLQHLKKLILSNVKYLTDLPDLNGTSSIELLRIDRCSISSVPFNFCRLVPKLKTFDLKSNKLQHLPNLDECHNLRILDFSMNNIEDLKEGAFLQLPELYDLHLHHNKVKKLTSDTFKGLISLRTLDLSYNLIEEVHPYTFFAVPKLEELNLAANLFPAMPTKGLSNVVNLQTFNNPNLKDFPGPESFPKVRRLVLSYAYHCCQFVNPSAPPSLTKSPYDPPPIEESVMYPTDIGYKNAILELNLTESWPGMANLSNQEELANEFWETFGNEMIPDSVYSEDGVVDSRGLIPINAIRRHEIFCIPLPGPFLPCNDLFDWWTLRCGVWIVFLLALMGNGTVVFVQIFTRTKMDVPRFLVCNLAIADFFMGIYLGFLAVIDAATLGEFRKFAIPWQLSSACQVAGFLGVLSSELSVFTLTVITLERHYVITHAMHLNKRLSLKHACYIMMIGWAFALLMAIMPLFGVSDYRKFAVCLPFETQDSVSLGYVVFLMFANGVAFTILMSCYVKMYCSIRGSAAWNSNETRIAKNMALLVFTDLLCWFPIAFFSLTAAFGLQLVSLEEAKVFTVFILPLNSCCNPFLYAILTKQFKKDCVLICKAIEESRVTRGIGRCRHSSNFSNRQTAPNTGSLTDKISKDNQPCICHSGLHPPEDVNGNNKYRFTPNPERLTRMGPVGRFVMKYILCHDSQKESSHSRQMREDPRMQNVRRYLYNNATANYAPDGQKHHRHPSVSSDNFSSSRSDSWRVQNRCGIPLRLLEPRRRNSWAVTRKPSQDSNLSSSRNDSSATSNSTATWRLSRSSVSSDANSHSGGGRSSFKRIPSNAGNSAAIAAAINRTKNLPSSAATAAAVIASGPSGTVLPNVSNPPTTAPAAVKLEDEIATTNPATTTLEMHGNAPAGPRRTSIPKTVSLVEPVVAKEKAKKKRTAVASKTPRKSVKKKSDTDVIIIDDDEASAKIATNRPRLVRQSAFFSEEVVIEPEICPVHGPLNPGTYDDEDEEEEAVSDIDEIEEGDEEEERSGDEESDGENSSPTDPILRKPSGQLGFALVIVPRRLSTISSRDTLSVRSRDEDLPTETTGGSPAVAIPCSSSSRQHQQHSLTPPIQRVAAAHEGPNAGPTTALLLPTTFAPGAGRRKMSEQPMQLFVVPASSGLIHSAKWHSMSSVDSANQSNQSSQIQAEQLISASRSQSRSQSPRSFRSYMKQDSSSHMTSMSEKQEDALLLPNNDNNEQPDISQLPVAPTSRNFGFRDPGERRVSFQLPTDKMSLETESQFDNEDEGAV